MMDKRPHVAQRNRSLRSRRSSSAWASPPAGRRASGRFWPAFSRSPRSRATASPPALLLVYSLGLAVPFLLTAVAIGGAAARSTASSAACGAIEIDRRRVSHRDGLVLVTGTFTRIAGWFYQYVSRTELYDVSGIVRDSLRLRCARSLDEVRSITAHFIPGESRIVIPHLLWWTYVQNIHGAFGMFGSQPVLLIGSRSSVLVLFWYRVPRCGARSAARAHRVRRDRRRRDRQHRRPPALSVRGRLHRLLNDLAEHLQRRRLVHHGRRHRPDPGLVARRQEANRLLMFTVERRAAWARSTSS